MRWHEQIATKDTEARLPGLGAAGTVTRTFDAPEALDTRFHEVHAKSVLNRVPGASKLPFGWTVNPYRGCAHACLYCGSGETKVLLADGRTKRLDHLRVGDEIYGTRAEGRQRRYVKTTVLDHWSTVKPAFRTTLSDGTTLVTSGDHRLLSDGGWKHVTGGTCGAGQRPQLTTTDALLGTGGFVDGPEPTAEYRRGYLCGTLRADASVGRDVPEPAGLPATGHRPRPAPADQHRYPLDPSDDWRKGLLAGLFDADGSGAAGTSAWTISTTDPVLLGWARTSLEHFGFDVVTDDLGLLDGTQVVRLRGGLREQLRFFHLTDPAITRMRDIEGLALESCADLRVVSIEPVSDAMTLYDITTGTGDFIAEGVVHHNCFARPTHEYLGFDAGRDFDKEIVVKVNAPEVLRAQLARPSWTREHIALGTNTDPYQWVEGRYKLTRGILEVLRDVRNPCSVLTKSPLLLRDLELLQELVELVGFSACLSIPTLDERAWRATEPHTPHPRKRLEAVAKLNAAGVPTGVLVAPLMPGINDSAEQVEAIVAACDEAGATRIGGQALFLRGSTRDVFMGWLRHQRPDLLERYEYLYGTRARLTGAEKRAVEGPLSTRVAARRRPDMAARFQRGAPVAELGRAHDGSDLPARGFAGLPVTVRGEGDQAAAHRPPRSPGRPAPAARGAGDAAHREPVQGALF